MAARKVAGRVGTAVAPRSRGVLPRISPNVAQNLSQGKGVPWKGVSASFKMIS